MTEKDGLARCACGGAPALYAPDAGSETRYAASIVCHHCGVSMQMADHDSNPARVVAAWNRRTPPARSIDAGDGREQDTARLDWLEKMVVNVRTQLVYGSRNVFWATPDEPFPSDIRKQIDRAMLAAAPPPAEQPSDFGLGAVERRARAG